MCKEELTTNFTCHDQLAPCSICGGGVARYGMHDKTPSVCLYHVGSIETDAVGSGRTYLVLLAQCAGRYHTGWVV